MTAEASLTKLSYLLAKGLTRDKVKDLMCTNMRGELTVLDAGDQTLSLKNSALLREVANSLNISSSKVKCMRMRGGANFGFVYCP